MTQRNLLTEKTVLNIQPRNEPFYLFDGDGLMLKVNPDGSKEWWADFIYCANGETSRDQDIIGYYPELTLDEARATKEFYQGVYLDNMEIDKNGEYWTSANLEIITMDILGGMVGDPVISHLLAKTRWLETITVKELFNRIDNISKEDFLSVADIPKNSLIIEEMKTEFLTNYGIKADELDQCKLIPVHQ